MSDKKKIHPKIKVQLVGDAPFFGPGMKLLLNEIAVAGSVRVACEKTGISYSKGRIMIDRVEQELGYQIVERNHGGKNGGGACVSERGMELLKKYEQFEREVQQEAKQKFAELFGEIT